MQVQLYNMQDPVKNKKVGPLWRRQNQPLFPKGPLSQSMTKVLTNPPPKVLQLPIPDPVRSRSVEWQLNTLWCSQPGAECLPLGPILRCFRTPANPTLSLIASRSLLGAEGDGVLRLPLHPTSMLPHHGTWQRTAAIAEQTESRDQEPEWGPRHREQEVSSWELALGRQGGGRTKNHSWTMCFWCSIVPLDLTYTLKIQSLIIQNCDFEAFNFVGLCVIAMTPCLWNHSW